jgi:hypothetical protein
MRGRENHGVRHETSKTKENNKEGHTEKEEVTGHAF